jgi:general secretion pathway protein E
MVVLPQSAAREPAHKELPEKHSPLAEILIERGRLEPAQLERALRLQEGSGERLGSLLVKLGLVSDRDVAEALSEQMGLPMVKLREYPEEPLLEDKISPKFLKEYRVLPIAEDDAQVILAMIDPLDGYATQAIELASGKRVVPRIGLPSDIEAAFERLYGTGKSAMGQIVEDIGAAEQFDEDDIEHLKDLASEAPVVRLVNLIIQRAVESRASDIHIEPFENQLKVRYRIDGVLREVEAPPARSTAAVISRIKIMAKLNIAERRLPQDGRIKLRVQGKELDLRVSCVPTLYGESVVMRLLDKGSVVLDFPTLGFDGQALQRFMSVLDLPHGIILVTGPTGSGKTTTLYTALHKLNTPDTKIITVEDPVEYQLEGINQIQVKPQIGLTFANALRSIVRQDPDVIMIGEMRDLETTKIAIQSALTGHLVLSTLHTNDAAGGITRLLDMGAEDYLLTSTVNGILAQRLVRMLCPHCRQPHPALPEVVEELRLQRFTHEATVTLYRPIGCEHCSGTGYLGRTTILEMLVLNDPIRRLVLKHADASEIQQQATADGMQTMYEYGLRKAVAGTTTLEEVLRVTQET